SGPWYVVANVGPWQTHFQSAQKLVSCRVLSAVLCLFFRASSGQTWTVANPLPKCTLNMFLFFSSMFLSVPWFFFRSAVLLGETSFHFFCQDVTQRMSTNTIPMLR